MSKSTLYSDFKFLFNLYFFRNMLFMLASFLAYNNLYGFCSDNTISAESRFCCISLLNGEQNLSGPIIFCSVQYSFTDIARHKIKNFNTLYDLQKKISSDSVEDANPVLGEIRDERISTNIEDLLGEIDSKDLKDLYFTETDLQDFYRKSIRLQGTGKLVFEDGSWMLLVSNSLHDEPDLRGIAIVVDSGKTVYFNFGQVSGGLITYVLNVRL